MKHLQTILFFFINATILFSCSGKDDGEEINSSTNYEENVQVREHEENEMSELLVLFKSFFFSKKNNPNNLETIVYKLDPEVYCLESTIMHEDVTENSLEQFQLDWDQIGFFSDLMDTSSFEKVISYKGESCAQYCLMRVDHLNDTICFHFNFQDSLCWLQSGIAGLKMNETGTKRFRVFFENI